MGIVRASEDSCNNAVLGVGVAWGQLAQSPQDMPAFGSVLSPEQIRDASAHVVETLPH